MGNRKQPFGYRMENGEIAVNKREADAVKNIFRDYLSGAGFADLAERLNERGVPYYPDKPWNKNMVARILADARYTGANGFPAIIDAETLSAATKLRYGKTAPCTATAARKTLRRLFGQRPTERVERQALRQMNRLIADPALIQCPPREKKDTPETAALKSQLDGLLNAQPVDADAAISRILRLAAARYAEIGDEEYETERLRGLFSRMEPMNDLDAELLQETISSVSAQRGGQIRITLKNGQIIEGGNSHDGHSAAGHHDSREA